MDDPISTFRRITGLPEPHPWQAQLATEVHCRDRLIRIPTGFGKTQGVLATWLHHRVVNANDTWPRRLVWCLPMRVLVEQTESVVREALNRLGYLWDGRGDHTGKVGVHLLMGGADAGEWHLYPEHPAVLIGTQDMLLSRALNRGYAAGRARWPVDFGLLNHDALWVMDEVQLMDVGLATSAQLQAFRNDDAGMALRPCRTWWMSATLQPDWLRSVDTATLVDDLATPAERVLTIPQNQRSGDLWRTAKTMTRAPAAGVAAIADLVVAGHAAITPGVHGRITLAIVNTVDRAVELHDLLAKRRLAGTDLRLIHSRFRGAERAAWRQDFLAREHCNRDTNRIIVATQVVEAGVDISAGCLVTELAPWPSLVQRFGRAARYGGTAQVIVAEQPLDEDKQALPYARAELIAARDLALAQVTDVAQAHLEDFETALSPADRSTLYPYAPDHLLLRQEWDELFDTTPDLSGADLDISRFLRSGEERDCSVFWAAWDGEHPQPELQPARAALCPVPFLRTRDWLCGKGKDMLKEGCRAYVHDYLDGGWKPARARDLFPGRVVLVDAAWGGYDVTAGFTGERPGKKAVPVPPIAPAKPSADELSESAADREDLSAARYQTIATHGFEVGGRAAAIAQQVGLPADLATLLALAGRWHDVGKAHPAFRACICATKEFSRPDLAKAPRDAWKPVSQLYDAGSALGKRNGFRHEFASALALLELLARRQPAHAALRGGLEPLLGAAPVAAPAVESHPLADEIAALTPASFDLLLFLIAAHHGKVRASLHATPADQEFPLAAKLGHPLRGVCDGDELPAFPLMRADGQPANLPALTLRLDCARLGLSDRFGRSWRERMLALQRRHGPAALAWLEAVVRTADVRASQAANGDQLLGSGNGDGAQP